MKTLVRSKAQGLEGKRKENFYASEIGVIDIHKNMSIKFIKNTKL